MIVELVSDGFGGVDLRRALIFAIKDAPADNDLLWLLI